MKCIKSIKQSKSKEIGDIIRTTNVDADIKVKSGHWVFIPKSEWKTDRVTYRKNHQVNDQVNDQDNDQVAERAPARRGKRSNEK
jgi:phage pi2 protein 07